MVAVGSYEQAADTGYRTDSVMIVVAYVPGHMDSEIPVEAAAFVVAAGSTDSQSAVAASAAAAAGHKDWLVVLVAAQPG